MVGTLSRCLRGSQVLICCVLVLTTAWSAGCTRAVVGAADPMVSGRVAAPIAVPDLLVEPARFPSQYAAAVLDSTAVYRALQDVDGVAAGSVVTPPECAPSPVAVENTAAAQGTDSETATTLIVAVTRPSSPLRARTDQLTACPAFTTLRGGVSSTVTVTVLPAPPIDADDAYAAEQTVTSEVSGSMRRSLTLAAQVNDVRVSATWLREGESGAAPDTAPDTQVLDALFTAAVLKVHRASGP
jgi:hypothetical protein